MQYFMLSVPRFYALSILVWFLRRALANLRGFYQVLSLSSLFPRAAAFFSVAFSENPLREDADGLVVVVCLLPCGAKLTSDFLHSFFCAM